MTTLAELVEALAVQTVDKTRGRDQDGRYGPSLLQQLRDARVASIGRGSGASAPATRVGMNMNAHLLWEAITGEIEAFVLPWARPTTPEVNLLVWWGAFSGHQARGETTKMQDDIALETLESHVKRIGDLFDPPPTPGLRDVACPVCGWSRAIYHESTGLPGDKELEVESDALRASFTDEDGVVITCGACGKRWAGRVEVIQLGRLTGETIDVDKIREALRPQVEAPWDPGGRDFEDLDPLRPEHAALTGGTT